MMQFSLNVYVKVLRSLKTYAYIIINIILSSGYFIISYLSNRDINKLNVGTDVLLFREYKVISFFGTSVYFITLGALLWFLILLEVMKYFRSNNDSGILLTHISRSYTRKRYFFSVITGIYLAFITIVTLNLLLTFFACIIVFKFYSIALLKMFFVALIYAFIHVAIIIIILTFIAVIFKQTEYSIMVSGLIIIIASLSIFLKNSIHDMNIEQQTIHNILLLFTHMDSYLYMSLTRNIFLIFNEQLADKTDTTIEFFDLFKIITNSTYDPDLHFVLYENTRIERLVGRIILFIMFFVNLFIFYITSFMFERMDIAGN